MPMNVSGADSSLGLCLFVKRLNVALRHMFISLNVFVQYPSAFLFLSLCCRNFNSRFHWFPMDRMQRTCFFVVVFFFTVFSNYCYVLLNKSDRRFYFCLTVFLTDCVTEVQVVLFWPLGEVVGKQGCPTRWPRLIVQHCGCTYVHPSS